MRHLIAFTTLVAIGAIAVAQQGTPPVAATHGKGEAKNLQRGKASFDFEAAKWVNGETSNTRGRFSFRFESPDRTKNFGLELKPVSNLAVVNQAISFQGMGKLFKKNALGIPVVVEGQVRVTVWDNKRPNQNVGRDIRPDKIRVSFHVEGSVNPPLVWEGGVSRGDLVVRIGTPPPGGTTGGNSGGTTGGN